MAVALRRAAGRSARRLVRVGMTLLLRRRTATGAAAGSALLLLLLLLLIICFALLLCLGDGSLNTLARRIIRLIFIDFGSVPLEIMSHFQKLKVSNELLTSRLDGVNKLRKRFGLIIVSKRNIQRAQEPNHLFLRQDRPGHGRGLLLNRTLVGTCSFSHLTVFGVPLSAIGFKFLFPRLNSPRGRGRTGGGRAGRGGAGASARKGCNCWRC